MPGGKPVRPNLSKWGGKKKSKKKKRRGKKKVDHFGLTGFFADVSEQKRGGKVGLNSM